MEKGILGWPIGKALPNGLLGYPRNIKPSRIRTSPPIGGYVGWWDTADNSTMEIDNTGAVKRWRDKSGNNNHLAATTNPPYYSGRTINGIKCIEFTPTQWLQSNTPTSDKLNLTSFIVVEADDGSLRRSILNGAWTGVKNFGIELIRGKVRVATWQQEQTTIGYNDLTTVAVAEASKPYAACERVDRVANTLEIWVNGTRTSGVAAAFPSFGSELYVGASFNPTQYQWDGLLGEIIIYYASLSDYDIETTLQYLREKWDVL